MPDRWFVPVHGVEPRSVRLEHVHAAFSRWFDRSPAEHRANDKPYALSPLTRDERGLVGVEIATLTDEAAGRLHESARTAARVRLGNQVREVSTPLHVLGDPWGQLARHTTDDRWHLDFVTPTTFRCGDRSSPLPRVDTIMDGLRRVWNSWADPCWRNALPTCIDAADAPPDGWGSIWVSDLDLRSVVVSLRLRGADGAPRPVVVSGILGSLTIRCEAGGVGAYAGPLIRLAAYCGVGGMTAKGFGVTRVGGQCGFVNGPSPDAPKADVLAGYGPAS